MVNFRQMFRLNTSHIIFVFVLLLFINCSSDDNNSTNNINTDVESNFEIDSITVYGGSNNERAQSVKATQDGGYVVTGYTQSNDGDITDKQNDSFDYWVLKFDAENSLQWQKTYGGTGDDRAHKIIQTTDGGYALLGQSDSSDEDVTNNSGLSDFWILKLDAFGTIQWQKSLGFSGSDKGLSLIQTNDLGYLLVGSLDVTASGGLGNSRDSSRHAGGDYWAVKLDSSANLEWSRYYGGTFEDFPFDVIQTEDLGYILVGSSDSEDVDISNNLGSYDYWVIKISDTGDLEWDKSFGGSEIDEAYAIAPSEDGNYIIIGNTRSFDGNVSTNQGASDVWAIKISPLGELLWEKSYGGSGFDIARSISKTQKGSFLIAGGSKSLDGDVSINHGQVDAWILRIDTNGLLELDKIIGGAEGDLAYDITEINNRKVVMVGESKSSDVDISVNKGMSDLIIVTLD